MYFCNTISKKIIINGLTAHETNNFNNRISFCNIIVFWAERTFRTGKGLQQA